MENIALATEDGKDINKQIYNAFAAEYLLQKPHVSFEAWINNRFKGADLKRRLVQTYQIANNKVPSITLNKTECEYEAIQNNFENLCTIGSHSVLCEKENCEYLKQQAAERAIDEGHRKGDE